MLSVGLCATLLATVLVAGLPVPEVFDLQVYSLIRYKRIASDHAVKAHRGGRGETIENSLHSFSWYGLNLV